MDKYLKALAVAVAGSLYLLALRYVAPSHEPYFILGIGLVGFAAWMLGTPVGLGVAVLLVPLTSDVYDSFSVSTSYASFAASPAYIAMEVLAAFAMGFLRKNRKALSTKESSLESANQHLQNVLSNVQEPGGIHKLCSTCKKIQNDCGEWQAVDAYLKERTKMEFSHCLCPECAKHFGKNVSIY